MNAFMGIGLVGAGRSIRCGDARQMRLRSLVGAAGQVYCGDAAQRLGSFAHGRRIGAAGIMGAMVGIHGPAISLVFQNAEPRVARGMLGAFFSVAYSGAVAALAAFGMFGVSQIVREAVLIPGVLVGLIVAPHIAPYIDGAKLRFIILAVAATSALVLLVR